MKLFFRYLRERRRDIALCAGFAGIFYGCFVLYRLPLTALVYPGVLCVLGGAGYLLWDFMGVKGNHEALRRIQSIADLPDDPGDVWDEDYRRILLLIREEHQQYCAATDQKYEDMIDYYTAWAHQIKTPIASMGLTLQNEDSARTRKLSADLRRIEQYVEMVLTFLRLDAQSTDYVIREYDLDRLIRQAVRKFSYEFIGRKLRLVYEPVHAAVLTDEKWLSFVLEQVLSNALKYTPAGTITITLDEAQRLHIRDTGMGIAPEDLPRIFEKGYTGKGGRTDHKASGIGLYLCKRICTNLGHSISVASQVEQGTTITIGLARQWRPSE